MNKRSSFFYKSNDIEISRYINNNYKTIHLINSDSNVVYSDIFTEIVRINPKNNSNIYKNETLFKKFDLLVITDLIEVVDNIFELLNFSKSVIKSSGKIVITSINPRWYSVIKFLELLNLKKGSMIKSYIYPKKIKGTIEASGLEVISSYNKQIFPYYLFGLGRYINCILEIIFCPFGFGLKTYFVCKTKVYNSKNYSKSLIIPAKNEEKNIPLVFDQINQLEFNLEVILIYGESKDNTENVCKEIEKKYKSNSTISVKVFKQSKNGKANAVFEALEHTSNEVIAILDSDLSVEPCELTNFYKIIDNGVADFVNGSRLISGLESGSMRFLNILGNRFFQFIINKTISQNISDSLCGTKVFKKENLDLLYKWQNKTKHSDPFGDFDLLLSTAYAGLKIVEYPIYYRRRIYGKTQISRFKDGFRLFGYIIRTFILFKTSFYFPKSKLLVKN